MTVRRENQPPLSAAWQLEFARLTAFPAEPQLFTDQQWWKNLTREQPDDFVSTRRKHSREDRGSFEGTVLSLTIDPSRVEWLLQAPEGIGDSPSSLPTLGAFREKADWFVAFLTPWLVNSCPPLIRLAFRGKLLQQAASDQDAYKVLATHLPGVSLEPKPNDFVLQINRRRPSTVVDRLLINRVSTWSKLNVAFSVERPRGAPFMWPSNCYSAVELDINTAPEWTEILPAKSLPGLFQELVNLGVEIAEHGDIP